MQMRMLMGVYFPLRFVSYIQSRILFHNTLWMWWGATVQTCCYHTRYLKCDTKSLTWCTSHTVAFTSAHSDLWSRPHRRWDTKRLLSLFRNWQWYSDRHDVTLSLGHRDNVEVLQQGHSETVLKRYGISSISMGFSDTQKLASACTNLHLTWSPREAHMLLSSVESGFCPGK